jgi:hypothetical protein
MRPAELPSRRTSQANSASTHETFYRPAELARVLHCSEWWVKEQARKRRIPFSWIGGSYLFTPNHLAEIVTLFEMRPTGEQAPSREPKSIKRAPKPSTNEPMTRLKARPPRRALSANSQRSVAA